MRVMAPCSWNSGADAEGGCGVTAKAPNVELRSRSSSTPTPTTGGSVTTGPGHSTWQAKPRNIHAVVRKGGSARCSYSELAPRAKMKPLLVGRYPTSCALSFSAAMKESPLSDE